MGQKFQYDESGSTFFYFLLSFLVLVLIPTTFFYWPRKPKIDPEEESKKCHCPGCRKKKEYLKNAEPWKGPKNLLKKALIIGGWLMLIFLAYKVSQFDYEMANFDPYEILGITPGASQGEIKKAYRKLSLILHPDKDTGNEKEFMKLSKAYQALTDDEARRNWEKYGNPDGPGAMSFGIALPSWIVEKENSVWVLGLYALVFMVALPIVVGTWWYRSIKFTGDQVLLDTTQMYYYFFHKTPNMPLKRVIMILAASLEFDRKHNSEIVERHSDNEEVPQLIKKLANLNEKNKERPLCFSYSIKARAIIHAHLSRIPLNPNTLELDRRYILQKCPYLIQEQVNCVNQLILLAYNRRIQRLPSIETIENCMKLCAMIVQGLWEFKSPLLQLPYVNDDNLKYFMSKKRQIKSLQQYAQLRGEERRNLLRHLSDADYENVMKVLGNMPYIDFQVKCEVMDDDNPTEVTAGAIVTVTVTLIRRNMSELFGDDTIKENGSVMTHHNNHENHGNHEEIGGGPGGEPEIIGANNETSNVNASNVNVKRPVWLKQKKGGGKKFNKKAVKQQQQQQQQQQQSKVASSNAMATQKQQQHNKVDGSPIPGGAAAATDNKDNNKRTVANANSNSSNSSNKHKGASQQQDKVVDDDNSDVESDDSDDETNRSDKSDKSSDYDGNGQQKNGGGGGGSNVEDDDDQEWEKFQKLHEREKSLEGRSKTSHAVHCPLFPVDKQEYWWTYICDRKSRTLLTVPHHVTGLIDREIVDLRFTAPNWPGMYTFTVCLRSDSYLGFDQQKDIKLDVKEAPAEITEHPQWEFEDSEEEGGPAGENDAHESEYTTDEDLPEDEDD